MTASTTEIDPDTAWCQAFLTEAKRLGEHEDGGELWEFMHSISTDPELRPLPPAEAARRFFKRTG